MSKYTIIIPAAGLGRRMKVYGPKSLIMVNGKHNILSTQYNIFKKRFLEKEVILIGGYQVDKIRKSPKVQKLDKSLKIEYNDNFEKTNVVHSIGIGLKHATTDKVVVIYGDVLFNKECLETEFIQSTIITTSKGMKDEEVGCIQNNSQLENIFYGLPLKWAQIAFFTGKELELLKQIACNPEYSNWYGFEAINEIINRGGRFIVHSHPKSDSSDIDSSYDLKKYADTHKTQSKVR